MYSTERHFVKTAHEQMCILEAVWSLAPNVGAHVHNDNNTVLALTKIKETAQSVQARGVYRSASLCEDVYARIGVDGTAKLRGALARLKCLVYQYADGLFEIDPEFKTIMGKGAVSADIDTEREALEAEHEQAADILQPLLKLVKNGSQLHALGALMHKIGADQPNLQLTQRFDALMRPVTNLTMSEARHSGKNVSISYAADFDELEQNLADEIQAFLEVVCLNIVALGVDTTRTQISLTGQKRSDRIWFSLHWQGRDISNDEQTGGHFSRAISKMRSNGGDIKFHKSAFTDVMETTVGEPMYQTLEMFFLIHQEREQRQEQEQIMPQKICVSAQGYS